ncbi:DUF2271 domain-containing protein [Paraburkholderia sp. MMS20-SJTR3]|uniref:DUF2271 domain-containing protein n=1 Tax=Paraburkholderia sejongensis TaxID=2886946 RepID=A0ABS8JMH5_9BURK|nr:DUF2271 domain-containing protein [Paraburkholderia sp. MMS20-SJTR3]MCC8391079.1 DUF2271 domain-containing protein [Paraburkholderia sp. MMS20-SJTR3]
MRRLIAVTLTGVAAGPLAGEALAAEMTVNVDLPRLDVAEYHRPYVSIWVERADQTPVTTLAVWYDQNKRNNEGTKWLKDMRQWWRKAGRDLQMPADGVSGATRAPGQQVVSFVDGKAPLGKLPAGEYQLVVETAREAGGRGVVRVPFVWPPASATTTSAKGEQELGTVTVNVKP